MVTMTLKRLRTLLAEALLTEDGPTRKPPVGKGMALQIVSKFPKGMAKMGIDVGSLSGLQSWTGTNGTAFDLGNGKVLKVTRDQKEAATSAVLVGKELANVVRIYAVWRFKDTDFYGILQEKLEPLPDAEGKAFNDALIATRLPVWIHKSGYDFEKAKEMTKQHILSQVKEKFKDNVNSPEAQKFAHAINDKWNMLVKKFSMRDMFNTLKQLGIDFADFHAGNLMRRADGTLALIDLGQSKITGGGGNIDTITQSVSPG